MDEKNLPIEDNSKRLTFPILGVVEGIAAILKDGRNSWLFNAFFKKFINHSID